MKNLIIEIVVENIDVESKSVIMHHEIIPNTIKSLPFLYRMRAKFFGYTISYVYEFTYPYSFRPEIANNF